MKRHRIRHARHNPDMTLAREAGATLASTVVGAAGALGLEKLLSGMKKGGTAADKDTGAVSLSAPVPPFFKPEMSFSRPRAPAAPTTVEASVAPASRARVMSGLWRARRIR